jgi:hypothetical protein
VCASSLRLLRGMSDLSRRFGRNPRGAGGGYAVRREWEPEEPIAAWRRCSYAGWRRQGLAGRDSPQLPRRGPARVVLGPEEPRSAAAGERLPPTNGGKPCVGMLPQRVSIAIGGLVVTTPAAPATPVVRHRRPRGVVIAAGVLLGAFGLLGLLIDADRGRGLSVAGLLAAGLLVLAAVGLLAAGRLGYWVGLAVAGLLAAVLALGWTRRPDAAGGVVVGVAAVPLVLLLLPQARRPLRPRAEPAASGAAPAQHRTHLPRPQGWPPELAGGWVKFTLSGIVAVVLAGAGLAMLVAGPGSVRVGGVIVALFGLGVLGALPLLRPGGRRGHLRQETLQVGDRQQRGVAFPYSSRRTAVALVTVSIFAVAMLAMAVFAQLLVEPGESVWTPRIIGVAGLVPFAFVAYRAARGGFGRRWRLVLTPAGGRARPRPGHRGGAMGQHRDSQGACDHAVGPRRADPRTVRGAGGQRPWRGPGRKHPRPRGDGARPDRRCRHLLADPLACCRPGAAVPRAAVLPPASPGPRGTGDRGRAGAAAPRRP